MVMRAHVDSKAEMKGWEIDECMALPDSGEYSLLHG